MNALGAAGVADRVDALRAEFDSVFAHPPRTERERWTDLLAVAIGDELYALRLSDLAGLHVDKPVTPLPAAPPAVRGLAGFRGAVVVVYDLAVLLGATRPASCRWIVATAANPAVAFGFSRYDGHLRVDAEQIAVARDAGADAPWHEVLHVDETVRPIVSVPALLDRIERPVGSPREGSQR